MPKMTINDVRYAFYDVGQGPAALLLHGFTGSKENWQPLINDLQDNFRLITVDLLGHGQTDAPSDPHRYRMSAAAADLAALLDAISAGPINLLGYSMGGRLALYLAHHYPDYVNSLVLESASPGLATAAEREARRAQDETLADRIEQNGIEPFVGFWEALPLWASQAQLTPSQRENLRSQRLQNRPQGVANSLRGMGTGAQPSLWELLPDLHALTLLITGQLDTKFVAINQKMAAELPNGTLHIVPDAGHTVHLEKATDYAMMVRHFWQRGTAVGA